MKRHRTEGWKCAASNGSGSESWHSVETSVSDGFARTHAACSHLALDEEAYPISVLGVKEGKLYDGDAPVSSESRVRSHATHLQSTEPEDRGRSLRSKNSQRCARPKPRRASLTVLPRLHELLDPRMSVLSILLASLQIFKIATIRVDTQVSGACKTLSGRGAHLVASNSSCTVAVPASTSSRVTRSASDRSVSSAGA